MKKQLTLFDYNEIKKKMLNAMIQRTVLSEAETQYIAVW